MESGRDEMKNRGKRIVELCTASFFVVCVIVPILSMLGRITPEGFRSVLGSPQFWPAVWNSVSTAFTAASISVVLSLLAAWCVERTQMKGKALFSVLFVLPMLIPSISHALGLVTLFGRNGLLTNLFHMDGSIYGFWGIVAGSGMYSFPGSFLMFSSILQYEDGTAYQAAEVLGIPPVRRFTGLTLPYLKKTLISAFFALFTMIVTDYGVPLMVRGKRITLSVLMYDKAVSMMDHDAGSVIGALLLLPAVVAFLVDLLNREKGRGGFLTQTVVPKRRRGPDALAGVFCTLLGICVLAPIASFGIMVFAAKYPVDTTFTLYHIQKALNRGAGGYLLWSMLYSVLAALFGTAMAFCCAYLTARVKGRFSKGLHLVSITSMAIPGIVLGLSYVIFFHGSALYGTIFIVVLADSIHFFASPYLMMYNTLGKIDPELEAVGQCLGVGRLRIIRDVILPKVRGTVYEMFGYFFVNSMMTISAVSFLVPPSPKPVALMINQFESQLLMESAAFVSLLILAVNIALKVAVSGAKRVRFPLRAKART